MTVTPKPVVCSKCGMTEVYSRGKRPEVCPVCKSPYWLKPIDERVLFEYQDELKAAPTKEEWSSILGKMYTHLAFYASNLIKNEIKNKFRMEEYLLQEKSADLANKIIERYLRDPDYLINFSFGGLMSLMMRGVLYGDAEEEKHDSLNAHISGGDGVEEDEVEETLVYQGFTPIFSSTTFENDPPKLDTSTEVVDTLLSMIVAGYNVIRKHNKTSSLTLFYLVGLYTKITNKNEAFLASFFDYAGSKTENYIKHIELAMYNHLMEGREHV